jgi:hypothetical protein
MADHTAAQEKKIYGEGSQQYRPPRSALEKSWKAMIVLENERGTRKSPFNVPNF